MNSTIAPIPPEYVTLTQAGVDRWNSSSWPGAPIIDMQTRCEVLEEDHRIYNEHMYLIDPNNRSPIYLWMPIEHCVPA